jgi:two-component system, response regulator PdtaR
LDNVRRGASFDIERNRKAATAVRERQPLASSLKSEEGGGRLRLLVVENNALLRPLIAEMLNVLGHEIIGYADTALTALAEAERKRPDVVLMDVELDGAGDGIDAACAIRNSLGIRSLFLTGRTDSGTRARSVLADPIGYVQKPLTLGELAAALARVHGEPATVDTSSTAKRAKAGHARRLALSLVRDADRQRLLDYADGLERQAEALERRTGRQESGAPATPRAGGGHEQQQHVQQQQQQQQSELSPDDGPGAKTTPTE